MSILCIGDPHIRLDNLDEIDKLLEFIFKAIQKFDPIFVVVLGDILHRHRKGDVIEHKKAVNFLLKIAKKRETYALIGNHDRPDNTNFLTNDHYFTGCRHPNLTIVDKVVVRSIDGYLYCFVPYVPNGRFCEALETQPHDIDEFRCIFAHQEFTGTHMGGIVSEVEHYLGNCICISGHIHEYQTVGKVVYAGAPIQHYHHESQDKGLLLFKSNDELVRLPTKITSKKVLKVKSKEIEDIEEGDADSQTKIVIEAPGNELHAVAKSSQIQKLRDSGVTIQFRRNDDTTSSRESKINASMSFYELLYGMLEEQDRQVLVDIHAEV